MWTFSCCFHCNTLLPLPSTQYYWHISQIIITFKGELLLSKCHCILVSSYPLSPPFPFDHNYTCKRVKWGEHGMGPMQHCLTTATPFKSQKILFKARALGSDLIHGRLSTSQLPILDPPSPCYVIYFISLLSSHPLWASPPPPQASRGSAIHVSLVFYKPNCSVGLEHWSTNQSRVAMDLTPWTRLFEGWFWALIWGYVLIWASFSFERHFLR